MTKIQEIEKKWKDLKNNLLECDEMEFAGNRDKLFSDIDSFFADYRQAIVSLIEELEGKIKELKCDERKVSVFGKRQDSWEARTYDEKQLVNAVLKEILSLFRSYKIKE